MTKLQKFDWFYWTLALFMVSLPFSEALISISGVLLFIVSLFQLKGESVKEKLIEKRYLLIFASIYLVYIIGFFFNNNLKWAIYDLRKNIPYLIIPFAFIFAKPIRKKQFINLLKLFALAVFLSSSITMIRFYLRDERTVLNAQEFGFIHHIRFSFEVIFSIVILTVFLITKQFHFKKAGKIVVIAVIFYLFLFLIWNQSFTGLIAFLGTAFTGIVILIAQLKNRLWKSTLGVVMVLLILVPAGYLYYAIQKFYTIDQVNVNQLDKETALGHPYTHDLKDKQIENGHYIGLYICDQELKEAWNKRADLKYHEKDKNGFEIQYTLIRYLTSKNLRKDAEGVNKLTDADIQNIEAGISNYILADNGLSLYPRIYVSIWELDNYFKTGNANQQSLSQRIDYAKAAFVIIKNHFWFGVGTGNWKDAYHDAYQQIHSKMSQSHYADAHNQYLNYMVKFGLLGLFWILFSIIYPVVKSKSYQNPLFFLFLISMLIANFGDSNFETHVGSSFFVLIYCLFLSTRNWDLKLPQQLVS